MIAKLERTLSTARVTFLARFGNVYYHTKHPFVQRMHTDNQLIFSDRSVCFTWECMRTDRKRYCFANGTIPGAMIYFVEDKYIMHFRAHGKRTRYHEYYQWGVKNKRYKVNSKPRKFRLFQILVNSNTILNTVES